MNATAMQNNNVVGLNVRSVYNSIQLFLNEEVKTENTKRAYRTGVEQFFRHMKGKELSELIYDEERGTNDLMFSYEQVLGYRSFLKAKYEKGTTINAKITPLKKLFRYLKKVKYNVDEYAFDLDDLPEFNSEKIGFLSVDETVKMIELAKKLPDQGVQKSLILESLYKTSIRVSAILNLEWKNIKKIDSDKWLIETVSKGKMDRKPISDDLYQRLLANKQDKVRLFTIRDPKTINSAIKSLCEQMDIEESRNISAHSFKKTLVNHTLQSGDIRMAARQGNHHIQTCVDYYEENFEDWSVMPGMIIDKETDISELEGLSKEELLEKIRKCSQKIVNEIASK